MPETIKGLDVSRYQGAMDFVKAKTNGADFVIIRRSQGTDYSDPLFQDHYSKAKAAGLKIGAYHFVTGDHALSQASWFKQQLGDVKLDFPVALDCERWPGGITNQSIVDVIARQFAGYQGFQLAMIYTNAGSGNEIFTNPTFDKYPLWVAHWSFTVTKPLLPNVWKSRGIYAIWQRGVVDGVPWGTGANTKIDYNEYGNDPTMPFPGETPIEKTFQYCGYMDDGGVLCGTVKEKC